MPDLVVPRLPAAIHEIEAHGHVIAPEEWWATLGELLPRPEARGIAASHVGDRGRTVTRLTMNGPAHSLDVTITRLGQRVAPISEAQQRFARVGRLVAGLTDATTEWSLYVTVNHPANVKSLVQLPVKVQTAGMTEIRGFRFARTEEPEYELIVERPDGEGGQFAHHAIFKEQGRFDRSTISRWATRAIDISSEFVVREESGSGN